MQLFLPCPFLCQSKHLYLPPQSPLKVGPSIRLRMASPVIGLSEDMRLPSLEIPTYVQMGLYSNWESGHHILDAYSNSESWNADETALYPIDYIYVKCRLYEDNALYRRAEDEQENAAVARVNVSGSGSLLAKREVYGNHEFRHAGYEDRIEESHAE